MASAMRVFRKFRSSDGRIKAATAIGVLALASAVAAFGILPALANHDPNVGDALVDPEPLNFGGGAGACAEVGSGDMYELWVNNPKPGKTDYTGPDDTVFTLEVTEDNLYFDFDVEEGSPMGVFDVTVNGGQKSLHYDYDKKYPVQDDDNLHAPTKGKDTLYSLSHINICYDEMPLGSVSGTKYHDRDTDGTLDATEEDGLSGWTITAFPEGSDGTDGIDADQPTDANGSYTISDLVPGDYTICEQVNSDGLPIPSSLPAGVSWAWTQSELEDSTWGADCNQFNPATGEPVYLPVGHAVTIAADVSGVDFANHRQATVDCSADGVDSDIILTLGGENDPLAEEDDPVATVTFPKGCQSTEYTTSFDLGRSDVDDTDDADPWSQFVVFSGDIDEEESIILDQTIKWDPEPAVYDEVTNELIVETTRVLLDLGGTNLEDVTFCHDVEEDTSISHDPPLTDDLPQCLDSRLIAEGGDVPEDHIQITEHYKLLGDPGNFR